MLYAYMIVRHSKAGLFEDTLSVRIDGRVGERLVERDKATGAASTKAVRVDYYLVGI